MSDFGDYLSWEYLIPAFGCALAYGWFIYRGVQVKRAGGLAAHSRAHLDRLFQMPPGEEPLEIDIPGPAVAVLVGWSRGEDVSRLTGPFPLPETL